MDPLVWKIASADGDQIGNWITRLVPVESLVPAESARWRPLVRDAIQFIFAHLPKDRLAVKVAEQLELPAATQPEVRLVRLIAKMPALQKLGQVLARNRRISPALRNELEKLENGMSDVQPEEIRAIIEEQLGGKLARFAVEIEPTIDCEASVSAVMRFTWKNPDRERERGVFKVIKPFVPLCFGEDMTLLQQLGDYLAATDRGYGFAVHDVKEMLAEVRLLLEHELDYPREQATLAEAWRAYRSSLGIRVPRPIQQLCTAGITAMTAEDGVKVTDACRRFPIRRKRIAEQVIEALIAIPLFSRDKVAIFHADPHAGNLLYDAPNRELIVLDWALAERLGLAERRQLVLLILMTMARSRAGVVEAIRALSRRAPDRLIERAVEHFFDEIAEDRSLGALDAMRLLDHIALAGGSFPPALFMFRKILFTLDGVLRDVAGEDVRIDREMTREFLTRWVASFGLFHAPLGIKDFVTVANAWAGRVRERWMPAASDRTNRYFKV